MDENLNAKLKQLHNPIRLIWLALLVEIIVLIGVGLLLDYLNALGEPVISNRKAISDLSMMLIVVLLFAVLFLKRNLLNPDKLIERAKSKKDAVYNPQWQMIVQEFGPEAEIMVHIVEIIRKYYLVIWSIGNAIVLIGFVGLVVGLPLRQFLIYAVVGLYSLSVNFPVFSMVERCLYRLKIS